MADQELDATGVQDDLGVAAMPSETPVDFRALLHAMPGSWVVLQPDAPRFTILAASEDYARAAMKRPEELLGHGVFEALPDANPDIPSPTGEKNVRTSLETVLRTRSPHRMKIQRYDAERPDGGWEEYYWQPLHTPVLGPDGEVQYIFETLENVTARVLAERAAHVAERQLTMAFMQAPALVAVSEGPKHRFVLANPRFEESVGRGDLVGRTVSEALPELEEQGVLALLDHVYATGEVYAATEQRILLSRDHGDAHEGWYNFVYQPLLDGGGQVTGILHHAVEVTAQVRARLEVEAARQSVEARAATLQAILESIPDALYTGTLEGITAANQPALDQLGFESLAELQRGVPTLAEEIQTRDAGTGRRLATEEEPFVRALLYGERVVKDVLVRHRRTGEDRVVRCSAAPVRVDGEVIAAVAVNTDVTEMRRTAAERERLLSATEAAREEAERANRAKGEFLAVMSHELRTPLNAISGYTDVLAMGIHGPITEGQKKALARIRTSQQHLLGLINDVLNYAKLETGTVRYDITEVNILGMFASVEELIAPQVRAAGLALVQRDVPADLCVRADPEKLRQILLNLMTNAIKFTDPAGGEGQIEAACGVESGRVDIRVRDTGIGIPAEKLETIFEPFVQVRSDLTRTAEGTGLGLAISRDLARGMEGTLRVESTPGKGSTFTLTLPQA